MEEKIYERTFWRNDVTQLNADNMNNIENGIEANRSAVDVEIGVDRVLIGNADNEAENCEAYVHRIDWTEDGKYRIVIGDQIPKDVSTEKETEE